MLLALGDFKKCKCKVICQLFHMGALVHRESEQFDSSQTLEVRNGAENIVPRTVLEVYYSAVLWVSKAQKLVVKEEEEMTNRLLQLLGRNKQ